MAPKTKVASRKGKKSRDNETEEKRREERERQAAEEEREGERAEGGEEGSGVESDAESTTSASLAGDPEQSLPALRHDLRPPLALAAVEVDGASFLEVPFSKPKQ